MTREQIHIGDMSHETAIGILKLMLEAMETYDGISPTPERINAVKMAIKALEQEPCEDAISRQEVLDLIADYDLSMGQVVGGIHALPPVTPQPRWIPVSEKYEHHIDHTDCIWYGNDSGCPVTCSQYRDGWNDAMEYIFKDGKGYQPYRREE